MVAVDVTAILLAIWAAFAIRLGEWWPGWLDDVLWLFPLAVATTIPALAGFGLYHSIVRHAGGSLVYVIVMLTAGAAFLGRFGRKMAESGTIATVRGAVTR